MSYISTKEAAEKWGISQRRVSRLADEGRICGAYLFGKSYMIPEDAEKPFDGRTKQARAQTSKVPFRFPFYMNAQEDRFSPPASDAENRLRVAQKDFFACRFEAAKRNFEVLAYHDNIYIGITALFFLCYLSVCCFDGADFKGYYNLFNQALSEDFPHKPEMLLLKPYLLSCLALHKSAKEAFRIDPEYNYSPSAYPLMVVLSFLTKADTCTQETAHALLDVNEVLSAQLEKDGHFYEAQMLHILLFLACRAEANEKTALFHLRKSFDIALRHELLYPVADIFMYYSDPFGNVLREYPEDFANDVRRFGNRIHKSYSVFMYRYAITDLYAELSKADYPYVEYAVQGYSNKQVAQLLSRSVRTVASRYAEIYEKLGIKSKKELIEKYRSWCFENDTERRLLV